MIQIQDKQSCVGCGACRQVCPVSAIALREDNEGFLYPHVDTNACIGCGLCEGVCPMLGTPAPDDSLRPAAFVSYSHDLPMRLHSSSGGLFTELSRRVLAESGLVFGAAFAGDFSVHHICAENEDTLSALRGSKYVQSSTEDTFRQAKQALEAGKTVLFSGTACQIAGLKKFSGKAYDNLITIDVLCHGVPSPMVWQKYLAEQPKTVTNVHFRVKEPSWRDYRFGLDYADGTCLRTPREQDPCMALFLQNVSLRPSCYSCRFKGMNRPSDITLGDCWGIESYLPEMDDNRGTNVVLVHTPKGQQLLDSLSDSVCLCPAELDQALPPAADARHPVAAHPKRAEFFRLLDKGESVQSAARVLRPDLAHRVWRFGLEVLGKMRHMILH